MRKAIIPDIIQSFIKNRQSTLLNIVLAIGVFSAIYFISKFIVQKVRERMESNSLQNDIYSKKMSKLAGNIIFIFLMIFNVLAVFQVIGFDTAIIMGGVSLSVGFAMETMIENMVAGVMFITTKKFKIGDYVEFLGDLKMKGTIEEINIRYSIIRSFDHRAVIIPNSILAETPIKTYKTEPIMRGEIELIVPRHVNIDQIQTLLNTTINKNKYVIQKEYTTTFITGFSSGGIKVKTFFFANPQVRTAVRITRLLRLSIMKAFKKYGIRRPYPNITLTA